MAPCLHSIEALSDVSASVLIMGHRLVNQCFRNSTAMKCHLHKLSPVFDALSLIGVYNCHLGIAPSGSIESVSRWYWGYKYYHAFYLSLLVPLWDAILSNGPVHDFVPGLCIRYPDSSVLDKKPMTGVESPWHRLSSMSPVTHTTKTRSCFVFFFFYTKDAFKGSAADFTISRFLQ